jgi:CHAT domain-containing protein
MGTVRWLHEAGWPPDQLKIRPGRAYYVIPNYPHPDYRLPNAELEYQFLQEKFKAAAVTPQPNPVRDLLSKPGAFDLLHFACHGYAEQDNISNAQIVLEGRKDRRKYIPAYLSATTVEQHSNLEAMDNCPMIVLNACQVGRQGYSLTGMGGFAQAFITRKAGMFLGTLWSVGDSPSRTFTETFYSSLLSGCNLAEATIQAREQARQAGDATWLAYVIYGHPHMKLVR